MEKEISKDTLGYLGLDFQYKLAKIFAEDSNFFENLQTIVDQNAFTDPLLRGFITTIKDHYKNNGTIPSYDIIEALLRNRSKTETDIEEWTALINKLKNDISYEGYDTIKELAIKFFKQQNLVKVANKILQYASNGDTDRYEECQRLLEEAVIIGQEDDLGYNIYEMQEKALSKDYTISIPTGIDKLDEVLGGGLDKGKIGLLIAPAGFGKTSFTTAIDAYAATYCCDVNNNKGFKVLQIYFEDDDVDITRKHYARILSSGQPREKKVEARFLKRLEHQDRENIAEFLNNHPNKEMLRENLRLKKFKTGAKSATEIGHFIKRLINSGFKPDLVSIDYFECIAPERSGYSSTDSEWTREGITMRVLENLAHELNCAIWVPTQGTKDSMNSPEVVRMDQASGSAKKVHVAQLILSIARAIGDIDKSRAVISILKNRSGKSGKIFNNVYFDNGTCTISCDDIEEFDDDLAWKDESDARKVKERAEIQTKMYQAFQQMSKYEIASNNSENGDAIEGNFIGHIKNE